MVVASPGLSCVRTAMRCERGFSLLEMVTVLVIIGVLVAIGVPAIARMGNGLAVDAASAEIAAVLRSLQGEATSYAADRSVTIDIGRARYSYQPLGQQHEVFALLPRGTRILPAPQTTFPSSGGHVVINWQPTGWGSAGTLALASEDGRVRRVVVQVATGRVVIR